MCIVAINGEEPITAQVELDEVNIHQSTRGKSKVNISLCRRKSYHRSDLEDICSRFDQVIPVVHILNFDSQRNLSPQRTLKNI